MPIAILKKNRLKLYNLEITSFGVTSNIISHMEKHPESFAVNISILCNMKNSNKILCNANGNGNIFFYRVIYLSEKIVSAALR